MTSRPGTSTMETDQSTTKEAVKRAITVDPDSNEIIQESKKPKIELDLNKKEMCITLLVRGFEEILTCYFPNVNSEDRKVLIRRPEWTTAYFNLPISIQIANIIFTLHTYCRQVAAGKKDTNIIKKSEKTEFTITLMGKSYIKKRDDLLTLWTSLTEERGLGYKNYGRDEQKDNWYGTFGPYIDFCCGFGLRMKELRLGHDKMPVSVQPPYTPPSVPSLVVAGGAQ
ncbi:unnamed protein product [Colias eurytheme]|nr:unnamed protein product [Colias eurytheme]